MVVAPISEEQLDCSAPSLKPLIDGFLSPYVWPTHPDLIIWIDESWLPVAHLSDDSIIELFNLN